MGAQKLIPYLKEFNLSSMVGAFYTIKIYIQRYDIYMIGSEKLGNWYGPLKLGSAVHPAFTPMTAQK